MRVFLSMVASALLVLPAGAGEVESAAKDIVGVWRLDFTTPDDVQRTPTVIVGRQREELVAWYLEKDKLEAFQDVCLKDDSVVATITPKEFGGELTVKLEARLESDGVCCGTGEYTSVDGESGSWEFRGKRIPLSAFDKVTQWNVSFTSPDDQQHTGLVTLVSFGDKQYGWYSGEDYELPIMRVNSDGGKLVLSVTAETEDGFQVDVTFRGTVNGDRVQGTAEYDVEGEKGSFPFTGKRKSQ